MRSSDFREFFPKAYIFPPTTVADPGIATQKTARSSSQSDDEMQSGSAQVRSTPGTASNASERESQDVEYSETDTVIDVGNTDFVTFDENGEQLERTGKKRRFDDFLSTEIQSLNETIELGYCHATQLSTVHGTKRMITRLRKQKIRLEETRDAWVWDHVGGVSGQSSSSTLEKVPLRDRENHEKFEKPQAAGRLSYHVMTSQLNGALAHIGQAIEEQGESLPDDAYSPVHRQLVESQNIINYVIRCMDYNEDIEAEISL